MNSIKVSSALLPWLAQWNPNLLKTLSLRSLGLTNHRLRSAMVKSAVPDFSSGLSGKVAVITASTEGIGYAIADRLGASGAHLVISSRKINNVEEATRKLKDRGHSVIGLVCHVSKKDDRKRLFEKALETFGGIDILVSNAAVNPGLSGVVECPEGVWDKIFEVNVKNAFQLSAEVVPHMKKRNGGSIVYVASASGYRGYVAVAPYAVSKTTLIGLTRAVAQEVVQDNIRVNCVSPGLINTKFGALLYENERIRADAMRLILMKRLGEPEEIAGIVSLLCSNDASYITGESFSVSGGARGRL